MYEAIIWTNDDPFLLHIDGLVQDCINSDGLVQDCINSGANKGVGVGGFFNSLVPGRFQ